MQKRSTASARKSVLLSLVVLGLVAAVVYLPFSLRTQAVGGGDARNGGIVRTSSHDPNLENYDIRTEKSEEIADFMMKSRNDAGKSASALADIRDGFARGEDDLRTRVSTLKVDYNPELRNPEVITPDVYKANIERLTAPSNEKRVDILRNFIKQNNSLVGLDDSQVDQLKVLADYTNPNGRMSFVHLEQRIGDVPVFRGEVKAGFTQDGRIIRVINNVAPGVDYESASVDFGDPMTAVRRAAENINYKIQRPDVTRNDAASTDLKVVFGEGDWATTAEKMYFPTEVGVVRPAWRVLIWQPVTAYYVIVDSETGTVLWRKNIGEDQTAAATYNVYANPNGYINVAESPYPGTPGPTAPTGAFTPDTVARTNVTLIGNEGPLSFNNNGWITDGGSITDGNAVQAGLDIASPDGVDAGGESVEVTPGGRDFTFTYAPFNPSDNTGDDPTGAEYRKGAVTQLFYINNRYHDVMYQLGFTEQAFNFQADNFGRGGAGADRVSAEAQDSSGTNNANFLTPADGGRGRMQMFRWTITTPNLDGDLDADIVIHEHTHGLSNRLHGNASGLSSNMSRGMGEGWSDFYAHALLSQESDPINGTYTTGGWATTNLISGLNSYYYGIRRFPKAVMAFTGGAQNRPHNPITFADIDQTTVDYSDGAFPAPTAGHLSTTADQVHTMGEVWSSALWEVRARMINRLGFQAGNTRALQVVTDGMKLAPIGPTYLQERDAIIAAASALPVASLASADVADVREGFRIRGMGFSAAVITAGTGGGTARVSEAFDFPNVQHVDPFSVSDSPGDNDGFPEPGENVLLSVPVTNTTGATITNVQGNVNGGTNVAYGDIADGATVTRLIPYTIPGGATCGADHTVQINVSSDAGAQTPVDRSFRLGAPVGGAPQTFENTTLVNLPSGQPTTTSGPAAPYPSTITASGLSGQKLIKVEITDMNHSWVDDIDMLLEGPGGQKFVMMSDVFGNTDPVATTFTISDGGADGLMPDAGPLVAGDYQPSNVGAGDVFDAPAPGTPHENPAPAGSATFASVFGTDGATMNGDWKLYIDDDAGGDVGTMAGWKITFESDEYLCDLAPGGGNGRADFDGDGRTDLSVFRGSEGNWYINGSTDGFYALNWGIDSDQLAPGDYDGDGKADTAVFRPSATDGTPDWWVLNSNGFLVSGAEWGLPGDTPVVGDYDGDGKDDIAVYRSSDGTFYIINSGGGGALVVPFTGVSAVPAVGDFDGDGKADPTTVLGTTWTSALSGGGTEEVTLVGSGQLVAGDYDGDGQTDQASFDSFGTWHIWMSSTNSEVNVPFGTSGDVAVPGDYDGDGKDDNAIYRAGQWWINGSTSGVSVMSFGLGTDSPIPAKANP
ncbi:MAG: M36 family metallopeptidase [Pyrinomonadaceae bacterium]